MFVLTMKKKQELLLCFFWKDRFICFPFWMFACMLLSVSLIFLASKEIRREHQILQKWSCRYFELSYGLWEPNHKVLLTSNHISSMFLTFTFIYTMKILTEEYHLSGMITITVYWNVWDNLATMYIFTVAV